MVILKSFLAAVLAVLLASLLSPIVLMVILPLLSPSSGDGQGVAVGINPIAAARSPLFWLIVLVLFGLGFVLEYRHATK